MQRFESAYHEMQLVEAEISSESLIEEMLDSSESYASDSDGKTSITSGEQSAIFEEDADLVEMVLDERVAKLQIPLYVGDLVHPNSTTKGIDSFRQVRAEPVLSEYVIFLDRLLLVLADYGKLLLRQKFRFEFGKLLHLIRGVHVVTLSLYG